MVVLLLLSAEKNYRIICFILERKRFKQAMIYRNAGVSKTRANVVVQWLEKKGYVNRVKDGYELVSPASLVNLLSNDVEAETLSFEVDVDKKKLLSWLKKKKAVFCTGSALQFYSSYFRDPSINVYFKKEFAAEFKSSRKGLTRLNLFKSNLPLLKSNVVKEKGFNLTSKIRTAIDLFVDKKAYAAEPLLKDLVESG